jgi:hypothetical protein
LNSPYFIFGLGFGVNFLMTHLKGAVKNINTALIPRPIALNPLPIALKKRLMRVGFFAGGPGGFGLLAAGC